MSTRAPYDAAIMDFRVLVVCSDRDATELLTRIFSEMAIASEHVNSAASAVERLETERYDAILLDYYADRSPQEFLAKLRQSAKNRNALLIAIVDGEFSARPVFGLGANFVLYRPLSPERARLSLRAARSLMRRERRRVPRIPVNTTASIALPGAGEQQATLVDLSDGGTGVQSQQRIPPACKVYFEFSLPGQAQLVRLSGEVAWQDASGRTGIRFVDVPQTSRRLMQNWLLHNSHRQANSVPGSDIPSQPSQAVRSTGGNRRGERRFPCKLGAEVYRLGNAVPSRCTLADISEGGCYVEMPTPLTGQTGVEIVVRTTDMKLRIRGQVLAVHPGFGMGVRFMFADDAEKEEVLRLLGILAAGPSLNELPR